MGRAVPGDGEGIIPIPTTRKERDLSMFHRCHCWRLPWVWVPASTLPFPWAGAGVGAGEMGRAGEDREPLGSSLPACHLPSP